MIRYFYSVDAEYSGILGYESCVAGNFNISRRFEGKWCLKNFGIC